MVSQRPASRISRKYTTYPMAILTAALQPDPATVRHGVLAEDNLIVPLHGIPIPREQMPRGLQQRLVSVSLVPCSENSYVEARSRYTEFSVRSVLELEPQPTVRAVLVSDDLPPRHDPVLPFALVRLAQALVVHFLVHPVQDLRSHDSVVRRFVAPDGFLSGFRGEIVEHVNAFGVEDDLVHARISRRSQQCLDCRIFEKRTRDCHRWV